MFSNCDEMNLCSKQHENIYKMLLICRVWGSNEVVNKLLGMEMQQCPSLSPSYHLMEAGDSIFENPYSMPNIEIPSYNNDFLSIEVLFTKEYSEFALSI